MFRTKLHNSRAPFTFDHRSKIITIGSCFSDTIGDKLSQNKFSVTKNPFGNIFNPHSIFKTFDLALNRGINHKHFIQNKDVWHHLDFHSTFSNINKNELEKEIDSRLESFAKQLKTVHTLILTLGTAIYYRYKPTTLPVANCHKIPQKNFTREFLSENKIMEEFDRFYKMLKEVNPDVEIILTLSPVRHLKEGFTDNSVSKAILRSAIHNITQKIPNIYYFPSYEIVLDDLRDYRFYTDDMLHPNNLAINYIWEYFTDAFFTDKTLVLVNTWEKISKSLKHRPFQKNSTAYREFLENLLNELRQIQHHFNVDQEIEEVQKRFPN